MLFIETFWTKVANKGCLSYKEVLRSLKNVREGLCVLYVVSSALERVLNCMFKLRCSLGMISDGAIVWLLKCTALWPGPGVAGAAVAYSTSQVTKFSKILSESGILLVTSK